MGLTSGRKNPSDYVERRLHALGMPSNWQLPTLGVSQHQSALKFYLM